MTLCALLSVALAGPAGAERFPRSAEVALPDRPVRLRLPLDARSAWDPDDGSDLWLVDADGVAVPFARAEGRTGSWDIRPIAAVPTDDPARFEVDAGEERLDRVEVALPAGVVMAWVSVERDGEELVPPTKVVRTDPERSAVPLPDLSGRFDLVIRPRREGGFDRVGPTIRLERFQGVSVPDLEVPLPAGLPVLQENSWALWTIPVGRQLPASQLRVVTAEENLRRDAGTRWAEPWSGTPSFWEPTPSVTGVLLRKTAGELGEERLSLPVPPDPSSELQLFVDCRTQAVPALDGVVLTVPGVDLVVPDPGKNPHTLYAGAPPGTATTWDLGRAADALRGDEVVVTLSETAPNPDWVPVETRADLVAPGAALDPTRWRWARSVTGEGPVRIPLPAEVLASARSDLGDLRLVTPDREQIPYLVRDLRREVPLALEARRREVGPESRIRVVLPEENLPGVVLTLTTTATVFDREVTVLADASRPLRRVAWRGEGVARPLVVELFGPVPGEFEIRIDNGDNPPIPLEDPVAVALGRELLAVLPPGGASLWYGAPSAPGPEYDLTRLGSAAGEDLVARASAEAPVGDREAVEPVRLRVVDKAMLGGGIGVFAVGLLLLMLDLLRKLPPPPPDPAGAAGSASPEPAAAGPAPDGPAAAPAPEPAPDPAGAPAGAAPAEAPDPPTDPAGEPPAGS